MSNYPGSNDQSTMQGNTKETYAKRVVKATDRFKKIKEKLKKK